MTSFKTMEDRFRTSERKLSGLWCRVGVYAIAALLPLERLGAISLGGTNIRPSQLVLLAVLLVIFKRLVNGGAFEWRRPEYALLGIFLGVNVLSLVNAENFPRSFTVLLYTVFTATLVVAIPFALRKKEDFLVVRNVILASAAAAGLFGIFQFLGDMIGLPATLTGLRPQYTKVILGFTRIQSTAIEPLYFANYLLLPLGFLLSMILSGTKRAWPYALFILLMVNLLLTSSRGGYLAFIAMSLVLAWMYREKVMALKRLFLIGLAGLALVAVTIQALATYDVTTPGSLSHTFFEHVTTATSGAAYEERIETFERSLRAFETHPFLGIGVGGYGPFSATFPDEEPVTGWAIVNNEPLELLAETGIMGLAAMIAFLAYILHLGSRKLEHFRELEPIRIATLAALVGIIVQYQTFSTLYIMHVWFTIGLLIAVSRIKRI